MKRRVHHNHQKRATDSGKGSTNKAQGTTDSVRPADTPKQPQPTTLTQLYLAFKARTDRNNP